MIKVENFSSFGCTKSDRLLIVERVPGVSDNVSVDSIQEAIEIVAHVDLLILSLLIEDSQKNFIQNKDIKICTH